jgi:pSer/pThr/pTyr-binding forkhead associated (FHA) protein
VTTAQSCVIEDLNSTNGIFLHSKRVRYHNLNDGDVITIGQHELLYIDERSLQRGAAEGHSAAPSDVDAAPSDSPSAHEHPANAET